MIPAVPPIRVNALNDAPLATDGAWVIYWMVAQRRTRYNFGLQQAIHRAQSLNKPLVVLEALRSGYRWASVRLHRFIVDGMADNAAQFAGHPVTYYPYLEPTNGAGAGLLKALASRAAVVITDEFPCFFLPKMVSAAAKRASVRFEQVDSNGVLPLRATDRYYTTAHSFRRHLHKTLRPHLEQFPVAEPLAYAAGLPHVAVPADITERWPMLASDVLAQDAGARRSALIATLPIDQSVDSVSYAGGSAMAGDKLRTFIDGPLDHYLDARNQPEQEIASGLSPYLHFGHISGHEIVAEVFRRESWDASKLAVKPTGSRAGWWGMGGPAESFIDQIITWRELGYVFTHHRSDDYDQYDSLPPWALDTLAIHATDPRPHLYTLAELDGARTHDPLWNAAQNQLRREGRIHNYLRMLWGKKILQWSPTPQEALHALIELNNRYAIDGRNPNSYSGIFWTLGRFDRAWGPERQIFGKVRYMTSENTARKVKVSGYIRRWTGLL